MMKNHYNGIRLKGRTKELAKLKKKVSTFKKYIKLLNSDFYQNGVLFWILRGKENPETKDENYNNV